MRGYQYWGSIKAGRIIFTFIGVPSPKMTGISVIFVFDMMSLAKLLVVTCFTTPAGIKFHRQIKFPITRSIKLSCACKILSEERMKPAQAAAADLSKIREKKPLIHSITNLVVMNETANATLCIGALPIMSHAVEEVEEMVGIASALVLNIGTLTPIWIDAMELAGKRANELGIPVILDPVGAGATKLRTDSSKRLLENVKISIVRGNAGEVATLAGIAAEVRGVESIGAEAGTDEIATRFASTYGCTVAITGPVDIVSDGKQIARISNGHPMLGKVVGTGCMSNVIVASFASVDSDPFSAAVGALSTFGLAGEMAAKVSGEKPGSFHVELYNALYSISPVDVESGANIKVSDI